ncbi:MAG: hypothetical protein IPI60_11705 [Saprospiraceae bacterium]|nr:hypothetical protein [Saprospiraceae bacterium]
MNTTGFRFLKVIPGVFEITADQRNDKQILEKYSDGFNRATLLREASGEYMLKVEFEKRGREWFELYPISAEELQNLRNALSGAGGTVIPPAQTVNKTVYNGRYYLITSATFHSIFQALALSELMTTTYTDYYPGGSFTYTEKTRFGRAFPLLVGAGTFVSSLFLTRDKPILASAANMHFFGSGVGYAHGVGLGGIILGNEVFEENNTPLFVGLTSLVEGWAMYYVAKKNNFDYARSAAWNTGNFWGTGLGVLAYGAITEFEEEDIRGAGVSSLVGAAGGIALMNYLQKTQPRTTGDLRAINTAGLIGATIGLGFSDEGSGRGAFTSLFAGSGLGLAASYLMTNHTSFDNAEGGLIALGSIVGGLAGGGIAIVADMDSFSGPVFITAAGAAAGWAVSYLFFKNRNRSGGKNGMGLERKRKSKVDFNFNPVAIGMLQQSEEQQIKMLQRNVPGDMLGFKLTF